ncbi:retinol-binding protein pinta isoform X4 [Monomorium pharaonis]|uniref:retinol-binding protein pinta isoform X4 n=1 Tax=Monomorium pharaonis TaxID=307658 RepID=UPI00102E11A8|nr:retinol-binding protein pinta isoform X4 [Monomorium pharaonis]
MHNFFILRFLRVCKFDLGKTKARMQNYYKQRSDLSKWYMNKDPFQPELQEFFNLGSILSLRKPDSQGRLVIIVRATRHDPRRHELSNLIKVALAVIEVAIKHYPAASVYGCALFIDVANPTIRHVGQLRPYIIKNIVHAWQGCYPIRIQSISMINAPEYVEIVLKIFRSFMTEKMRNRLHVYTQNMMHNCFKDIPDNILPVEYGGTNGTLQELIGYWKKLVEENRDWITENENDRTVSK